MGYPPKRRRTPHVQRQIEKSHERPETESGSGLRDDRQIQSSICQYLAGAQVPPDSVQRNMAAALGLDAEYFTAPDAPQHTDPVPKRHGGIRQLSLKQASALLGVDKETVGKGLQQGVFPWGYGVKTSANRWRYIINADRFSQIEGVEIEEGEST